MKITTLFFAFALAASASLSGNPQYELTFAGGSWAVGTGIEFTQFTLNSFDVIVPTDGTWDTFVDGTVTLPQAYDGSMSLPTLVPEGNVQFNFGGTEFSTSLYAMVFDWNQPVGHPDYMGFDVQGSPDAWELPGPDMPALNIHIFPVWSAPGTVAQFEIEVADLSAVPEPGTGWMMLGAAVVGGAAWACRNKRKAQ